MAQGAKRKIVFMGTPRFGAMVLEKLWETQNIEVAAVFTQPDKKAGRGNRFSMSEVKQFAIAHNLPVFQPASLSGDDVCDLIKNIEPDFIVVAAYGLLLPQRVLDLPRYAPLNVHGSLLPAYRGAAPAQRAIIENPDSDATTGVTIMEMVKGLDAGPIYAQAPIAIGTMDSLALLDKIAENGSNLLVEVIDGIVERGLKPRPQDESKATYAAKLSKEDGELDWTRPVAEIDARIRGVTPWPGANADFIFPRKTIRLKIFPGRIGEGDSGHEAGAIFERAGKIGVACVDGWYELVMVQPQNKKIMTAADFVNGIAAGKSGALGKVEM